MGDELAHYMFQGQTPAYPYPDPYYRSIFAPYESHPYPPQPYPTQPMAHFQLMGIQQAGVPLPSDAVEKHVFVNAKQYHGILRRRQSHAKDESQSNMLKPRKPYLHESRHLHALKRARGCGVISSTQRRVMMMKTTERACFKPKITSKLYALHQKKHHHPPSND